MLLALAILVALVVTLLVCMGPAEPKESFWTQYGGAVPPCEQVRRFYAAEKGVPDPPWAETHLPRACCC